MPQVGDTVNPHLQTLAWKFQRKNAQWKSPLSRISISYYHPAKLKIVVPIINTFLGLPHEYLMFTCNKTSQKTHTFPKFPPRFADHFAPMWCEESPARHHRWFIFICSIGLPQFISDFPENCQWFCLVLEENQLLSCKPT